MSGGDGNSVGSPPPPNVPPTTTGSGQSGSTSNSSEVDSNSPERSQGRRRYAVTVFGDGHRPRRVRQNPTNPSQLGQVPEGQRPRSNSLPLRARSVTEVTPPSPPPVSNPYSVDKLRASFGGLIERIAGGAQTVTAGYDKTARSHIDNIRAVLELKVDSAEKTAAIEYLDYLEQLLPPRAQNELAFDRSALPNGKLASNLSYIKWQTNYVPTFTELKGSWALIAGDIASLQNASDLSGATARINEQLATARATVESLQRARAEERETTGAQPSSRIDPEFEAKSAEAEKELDDAIEHIAAYQAYLEKKLTDKSEAIEVWAQEHGPAAAGAFQKVNESLNKASIKNRDLEQTLKDLRAALDDIPASVQDSAATRDFLQAQEKFLERQILAQEIWKRSVEGGSPNQTDPQFLKARLFLHQNAFAALDRITARHSYSNQLLDRFSELDMTNKSLAAHNIRDLLLRNQQQFDELLKSIEPPLKANVVKTLLFDSFKETQEQLAATLKRVESTPTPARAPAGSKQEATPSPEASSIRPASTPTPLEETTPPPQVAPTPPPSSD